MESSSFDNPAILDVLHHCPDVELIEIADIDMTKIDAAGGIKAIVAAIKHHIDDSNVQLRALRVLDALVADDSHSGKIIVNGGIDAIIQARKHHLTDPHIEAASSSILVQLSNDTDFASKFCEAGGIEVIIQSMKDHKDNADLQKDACCILCGAARGDAKELADDDDVQMTESNALNSVCHRRDRIAAAGGIEAIIQAMNNHVMVAQLQEIAVRTLAAPIRLDEPHNDGQWLALVKKMVQAGAIEATIQAIQQHVDEHELQRVSCVLLSFIYGKPDLGNAVKMLSAGCIVAIIKAMKCGIEKSGLQADACCALGEIIATLEPSDLIAIGDAGIVDAVVDAMKHHPDEQYVQHNAISALANLSSHNESNININTTGGDEAIIKAMDKFGESVGIQCTACQTLANVTSSSLDHSAPIVDAGGIEMIVKAMKNHADDARVQYEAMRALSFLSRIEDNSIKISAAGGINAIIEAMKQLLSVDFQNAACDSLFNLACNDTNRKAIIAAGGIAAIWEEVEQDDHDVAGRWYRVLGKLNYGDIVDPSSVVFDQCHPNKRQKKSEHAIDQSQPSNQKPVDFFTTIRPSSLILSFVSNHAFYCMIPSLSRAHQTMMHDDVLHHQQCISRLPMTAHQYQLFGEARFPLLYIPMKEVNSVANAHRSLLDRPDTSHVTQSAEKVWWLECTRLYLHLASATRLLTRHAPTHFLLADGHVVSIKYVLPRLVQSVLIDELTSFYVFNLLRRYTDDGYHNTIMFEGLCPATQGDVAHRPRIWYDYTKGFNEFNHISLEYYEHPFNEVSRSHDHDDRLKFLHGEVLFLGNSTWLGAYEYSHYLWFGPSLKQAADALALSSHRSIGITVTLESAVPLAWDMKNGKYLPSILSPDVEGWLLEAGMSLGNVKPRELLRLYNFVYGDRFADRWHWDMLKGKELEEEQVEDNSSSKTTYGDIAHSLERRSVWWSREQQMWQDIVVSRRTMTNNNHHQNELRSTDEQEPDIHSEMLQQYLYFVAETGVRDSQ